MKNYLIILASMVFALVLATVEALFGCPFEFRLSEFLGGIFILLIGLLCVHRQRRKKNSMAVVVFGGVVLICCVNVAMNGVDLFKMLFDACSGVNDGLFVLLTMALAVYVPFVYVGAIFLYLYYLCNLREAFKQMQV